MPQFRIFKMSKYSSGATLLGRTLVKSLAAMQLLFFFSFIGLIVFATIIYFCETGTWMITEDYPGGICTPVHQTPSCAPGRFP
jgi:hypothetical protein